MKKISFLLLVIFIVLLIFSTSVNASESTFTETLPSIDGLIDESKGDKFLIIYTGDHFDYNYRLYVFRNLDVYYTGHYFMESYKTDNIYNQYYKYEENYTYLQVEKLSNDNFANQYNLVDGVWVKRDNSRVITDPFYALFVKSGFDISSHLRCSNFDIYMPNYETMTNFPDELKNNSVFQEAPSLSTLKGMNFQTVMGAMTEMMKKPVVSLIVLLIGLVALEKGLQFLSTHLRKG